ncbi:MAG: hypothetical protein EPO26_04940 [Chloroflexota bacterium]|nr:MAG: hypothetical protein EPO26_04940 [Chloroflexota bacterium]
MSQHGHASTHAVAEKKVVIDGVTLVCHHPRPGIWCCCSEEGHALCQCATTLDGAIKAWQRHDNLGE